MSGFFRRTRPPASDAETKTEIAVPAGTDLDRLVGERPATQRRGRLRRRLRHLRSVREVLFRDLGGFVFERRRTGAGAGGDLQEDKLARLGAVDGEIRELEAVLEDRRGLTVREPGIGGTCPVCGELFGSDARFCWACGTPVAPGATRPPSAVRPTADPPPAALIARPYVDGTAEDAALPPPPPPPPPPTGSAA